MSGFYEEVKEVKSSARENFSITTSKGKLFGKGAGV